MALQDALATFAADRIVIFEHPAGDRDAREDTGLDDVEQRFGIPVTRAVIGALTGRYGPQRFDTSHNKPICSCPFRRPALVSGSDGCARGPARTTLHAAPPPRPAA